MRALLTITGKDLRRSVRDRSALFISIGAPLILAFILSTVLGGAGDEQNFEVSYGVVDLDGGPLAQTFRTDVLGGLVDAGFADVRDVDSETRARTLAEDDDISAAFIIPEDFSESVQAGQGGEIEVVASPDSEIGGEIANSVAQQFASELDAVGLSIGTVAATSGTAPSPDEIEELSRRAAAIEPPIQISESDASSRQFDADTFFPAGMAVFFLFFTTQFGAISLLRERTEGTLARLMVAPISRATIVAAKGLFTFVLGVVSMTTLIVASKFLLGAKWGDAIGVGLLVLAGVFAATGIQSLVTTLAKTDQQAAGYGSIIAVTLGLLGGTFFPVAQAPGLLADLSFVTPHAWLMRGLGELSGGAGAALDVLLPVAALVLFGLVTGTLAMVRARGMVIAR
jgi:ABC-2 type transport system permease protein